MKTLLVSFFGSSNLGDLLISNSLENKVKQYSDDVISMDYLGNEIVENMNIENYITSPQPKNNQKEKMKQIVRKSPFNQLAMIAKKHINLFSFPDFDQEIAQAEALIIGGGNMIFDLDTDTISAKRFDYYVSKAKEYQLPVFAISLGIGPFQNKYQQKYAVEALSKCDYITFRDNTSLKLFKEFNPTKEKVTVVPDPVFFMETKNKEATHKKIGMNIINPLLFSKDLDPEEVKMNYVALIQETLQRTGEEIVIFNTEIKDYPFCQEVYNQLNESEKQKVQMTKVTNLTDLYNVFDQTKLVVGTRMHSLITAFSQGIPIVGLSWQQKVDAMFDLVHDPKSVFSLLALSDNIQKVVEKVADKLEVNNENHPQVMADLKNKERINEIFFEEIFKNSES